MKLFKIERSFYHYTVYFFGIRIRFSNYTLPITVYLFDDNSIEQITSRKKLPKHLAISVDSSLEQKRPDGTTDGKTNILKIHKNFKPRGVHIAYTFGCTNSLCVFEDSTTSSGIAADIIMMSGDKNELKIGKGTGMNGTKIVLGNGSKCFIGKDCMFSYDIVIRTTDGHVILDKKSHKILNKQKNPYTIGDHCWIGLRTIINKNAIIPDNTIVGSGSVIASHFDEQYTVIAGNPCKVIKQGVTFDGNTIYKYKKDHPHAK